MKYNYFPFVAIWGQEKVKEAILLSLINPHTGGILISGGKGAGKSTMIRGAKYFLDAPWVEVPLSVTEDRLFGTIDMESALLEGKRTLLPGLIHSAEQGMIYIDDVNLFREDLLSALLDIKEQQVYFLERDGISLKSSVFFNVAAVMNPEEGTLSVTALDHFGLFVETEEITDVEGRKEIARRYLDFEKDGDAFHRKYEEETSKLKVKIKEAQERLTHMEVSSAMLQLAAVYALKAHVAGHRADIYLIETAKAEAALHGRDYVLPEDLERAAEFVLPHRMRKSDEANTPSPEDSNHSEENTQESEENQEQEREDNQEQENNVPPPSPSEKGENHENEKEEEKKDNEGDSSSGPSSSDTPAAEEKVDIPDYHVKIPPLWIDSDENRIVKRGTGKRSLTRTSLSTGRYVRVQIPKGKTSDIAFDATLRAAAPYQKGRTSTGCKVVIKKEDIRSKVREKRIGNILLLVVDASGSMGVAERMKTVKGVIFKILMDAYQKRDRVGLIAFRKNEAELLLPVTRSVDFAKQKLETLPVGGKTPLAKGLMKAQDVLDMLYRQDNTQEPVVILVTDGRATSAVEKNGNPVQEAMMEASRIGRRHLPTAVIDTESGFIKLGLAKEVAKKMGASYFHMDKLTEENLLRIWKSTVSSTSLRNER